MDSSATSATREPGRRRRRIAVVAIALAVVAGVVWGVAGTRAAIPAWRLWTSDGGAKAVFVKVDRGAIAVHRQAGVIGPQQVVTIAGAVPTTTLADSAPDASSFNAMTFGESLVSIAGPKPDLAEVQWWPSHGQVTTARLNVLARSDEGPVMASVTFETFVTSLPLWMVIVALLAAAAGLWWSATRSRRPALEGFCPTCEYDLRATPGRCPECGWAAEPDPTPTRQHRAV